MDIEDFVTLRNAIDTHIQQAQTPKGKPNEQELSFPELQARRAPKLHQQLYGIKAVEIDHARDLAFAWYGGAEVLVIRCSDGSIMERHTLDRIGVAWTLDEDSMTRSVKAALRAFTTPLSDCSVI